MPESLLKGQVKARYAGEIAPITAEGIIAALAQIGFPSIDVAAQTVGHTWRPGVVIAAARCGERGRLRGRPAHKRTAARQA